MTVVLFLPELTMLLTAAAFLAVSCARPDARRDYGIAVTLAALCLAASLAAVSVTGTLFSGAYRLDLFSQLFKALLCIGFFLVVFVCDDLAAVHPAHHGETYLLLAVSTLAMMLLVSCMHLLTVFLALELSSYSLYILVLLHRDSRRGMESGLRYFLVGASASAIMLFGLAFVYAATGAARFDTLAMLDPALFAKPVVAAGMLLTLGGFFFKLAVFPFHFWAPDAYEGAPNQVAAFIATVSKVAAVAIIIRFVAPAQSVHVLLVKGLVVMAVISMTVGNLSAIAQRDFKRLMAFSSVAHAGYLLLGILCMSQQGYAATAFYAAGVLVMKFTCFFVMIKVAEDGRNLQIAELAGLHRRSPLLALALMMALFGLAGIPPTIGFAGKLLIFTAAVQQGYLALVVIAMINVVVSLYYYLLVLKAAYLDPPPTEPPPLALSFPTRVLAVLLIGVIVFAGFYPSAMLGLVQAAVGHF
jgi:NADH-quinone oxidoreductase subunit N